MSVETVTCPFCGRVSYNANDVAENYCGACHVYHGEIGRELKASELREKTVVVLKREIGAVAATMWVHAVLADGVDFYAGEGRIHLLARRDGDELRDDVTRLRVFEYRGKI